MTELRKVRPGIFLTALNSKYIHSNPAVVSLKAYAGARGIDVGILEFTINRTDDDILRRIYREKPDIIAFSVYIWNIETVKRLISCIGRVLPNTKIWLGGPEVSFHSEELLLKMPEVSLIMRGEGEETFYLLSKLAEGIYEKGEAASEKYDELLSKISGITYRDSEGNIRSTPDAAETDMDLLPFAYDGITEAKGRIIYYESQRGCPYACSYCLSSTSKRVRMKSLDKVFQEMSEFLKAGVKQVKFVDRTFNISKERSLRLWRFLKEYDNKITNFHFEISGDILSEEEIRLLTSLRKGQVQLEIGVQSTNEKTLMAVNRRTDKVKLFENAGRLIEAGNVHVHLDLIAGLPFEDLSCFKKSFNEVYALHPMQLQLGFLKVLQGSPMELYAKEFGCEYKNTPPYEVLKTGILSYDDIILLKDVEEMVEIFYNSGQFAESIRFLEGYFNDAFSMYERLADFSGRKNPEGEALSRTARFELLLSFAAEIGADMKKFIPLLSFDLYARENAKNRPYWAADCFLSKEEEHRFYDTEAERREYLPSYSCDARTLKNMTQLLKGNDGVVLFDYSEKDPVTGSARIVHLGTL